MERALPRRVAECYRLGNNIVGIDTGAGEVGDDLEVLSEEARKERGLPAERARERLRTDSALSAEFSSALIIASVGNPWRGRQSDHKTGSPARRGIQPHVAAVVDYDLARVGKAETPAVLFAGGRERLEQAVAKFRRDARSGIENLDDYRTLLGNRGDTDRPSISHHLQRVCKQIGENGADSTAVYGDDQVRGNVLHDHHGMRFGRERYPVYGLGNQRPKIGRIPSALPRAA